MTRTCHSERQTFLNFCFLGRHGNDFWEHTLIDCAEMIEFAISDNSLCMQESSVFVTNVEQHLCTQYRLCVCVCFYYYYFFFFFLGGGGGSVLLYCNCLA